MRSEPKLQKPRTIGSLRKDQPLAANQVRCSCGQVFTANEGGYYEFPQEHATHLLTYAYHPPKG
jgi:hypothetical protein